MRAVAQQFVERERRIARIARARPRFVGALQPAGLKLRVHHRARRLRLQQPGRKVQFGEIVRRRCAYASL